MSGDRLVGTRGRGLTSSAARCFLSLALLGFVACTGQSEAERAANDARTIASDVPASANLNCYAFPDTMAELLNARQDVNDLPDTRIVLDAACPRASVVFAGGARLQRTYRVEVPRGHTLVARARGEFAPVVLSFDYPALPKPDSSNLGIMVVDSLKADADREVAVRVMLSPRVRTEPRESRVLLTVYVRP